MKFCSSNCESLGLLNQGQISCGQAQILLDAIADALRMLLVVLVFIHQSLTRHHASQILFILTVLEFRYITCARPLPHSQISHLPTYQSLHLPSIQPPVSTHTITPNHTSSTNQANLQHIMSSQPINYGNCCSTSSGSSTSGSTTALLDNGGGSSGSSTAAAGSDATSTAVGTDSSGSNGPGTDPWGSDRIFGYLCK